MISDYGKEIFLFTLDAVAFAYTLKWYSQTCKAQQALSGPVMTEHKSLEVWMKNNSETSWLVLQGAVEPIGPVIRGFNDRSIKGVVQRLNIKEFVTSRNTSGFWQDGERVIADTFNTVPYGIRIGRSLVNVEDSLNSNMLSLRTVSSEFTQKSSHLLDHVWSFLIGTRHRGIQSTEQMLLCGTKITAIGAVTKDKTLSSSGLMMQPYCLSELTVLELQKHYRSRTRWSMCLLLITGCAGAAIIAYTIRKLILHYRKKVEEDEKKSKRFKNKRDIKSGEPTCIVCENPREVILLPCGHICLCYDCSQAIERKCPMCRATIESVNEYYIT